MAQIVRCVGGPLDGRSVLVPSSPKLLHVLRAVGAEGIVYHLSPHGQPAALLAGTYLREAMTPVGGCLYRFTG
jgi:hypothetical protein